MSSRGFSWFFHVFGEDSCSIPGTKQCLPRDTAGVAGLDLAPDVPDGTRMGIGLGKSKISGEHGSLNVPIEHHPTIRYMVYNGYFFRWCPIFPKWDSYQPLVNEWVEYSLYNPPAIKGGWKRPELAIFRSFFLERHVLKWSRMWLKFWPPYHHGNKARFSESAKLVSLLAWTGWNAVTVLYRFVGGVRQPLCRSSWPRRCFRAHLTRPRHWTRPVATGEMKPNWDWDLRKVGHPWANHFHIPTPLVGSEVKIAIS